jgi:hypothetical protein
MALPSCVLFWHSRGPALLRYRRMRPVCARTSALSRSRNALSCPSSCSSLNVHSSFTRRAHLATAITLARTRLLVGA